jgi:predicted PurR-regulated permease PerM
MDHDLEPPAIEDRGDRLPRLTPISLFLVLLTCWVLIKIQLVLVLGLMALLLGTILEGPVQRIEQRRVPRAAAISMVYAVFIGGIVLFGVLIAPSVADQAREFQEEAPAQFQELRAEWIQSSNPLLSGLGQELLGRGIAFIRDPGTSVGDDGAQAALPVVQSIGTALFGIVTCLVITFYYLLEKSLIRRVILDYIHPDRRERVNRVWQDAEAKVGGWMRGQLLLCLIIGTIATTAYGIIDLRFWPLLGLWAGLTEIIPIVGPWLGGVPAVLIALTMDFRTALITALIILGIQTLENWFLVPRVMRGAVGLTPMTVFVAILAGTQLLGVVGAILAIPIAATLQLILTDWLNRRRGRDAQSVLSGWRWMLNRGPLRDDAAAPPTTPPPFPTWDELQANAVSSAAPSPPPTTVAPTPPERAQPAAAGQESRWRFFQQKPNDDDETPDSAPST